MQIHGRWRQAQFNKRFKLYGDTVTKRINYFFKKYADLLAIGICMRFSIAAAKYTPPNIGRAKIDQKYYSRPIYSLSQLAKGTIRTQRGRRVHATAEDYVALRAGFKFKIVNTRYRASREEKRHAVGYARTASEAKKIARIQRRGLSKYSWGSMINNLQEDLQNAKDAGVDIKLGGQAIYQTKSLPPIFERLVRKSPAIQKYKWGSFDWKMTNNDIQFTIRNRLTQIQRYGQIAIQMGSRASKEFANKVLKGMVYSATYPGVAPQDLPNASKQQQQAQKLRKMIGKLFDDLRSYGIEQFVVTGKGSTPPPGSTVSINLK